VNVDESDMDVDSDEHDQIEEKDKWCVCGKFEPDAVRKSVSLIFVCVFTFVNTIRLTIFCHIFVKQLMTDFNQFILITFNIT
jgi:hypothetical protein